MRRSTTRLGDGGDLRLVVVVMLSMLLASCGADGGAISIGAPASTTTPSGATSTSPTSSPAPSSVPTTIPTSPCSTEALVRDLGSIVGADLVAVDGCDDGWVLIDTYASCVAECGDRYAIARLDGARWDYVTPLPSQLCRDQARAFAVPERLLGHYGECPPPTTAPAGPAAGGMCPQPIEVPGFDFGPSTFRARIDEGPITCDEAAAVWREYITYPDELKGGNTLSVELPSGWSCTTPTAYNAMAYGYDAACGKGELLFTMHASP